MAPTSKQNTFALSSIGIDIGKDVFHLRNGGYCGPRQPSGGLCHPPLLEIAKNLVRGSNEKRPRI